MTGNQYFRIDRTHLLTKKYNHGCKSNEIIDAINGFALKRLFGAFLPNNRQREQLTFALLK